jgi:hypothetical protein
MFEDSNIKRTQATTFNLKTLRDASGGEEDNLA